MKKWYAPSLLWLAVCTGTIAGCAQTSRFVARWTGKDAEDSKTAQVDGKAEKESKSRPRDTARIAGTSKRKPQSSDGKAVASATERAADKQSGSKPSGPSTLAEHKAASPKSAAPAASATTTVASTPTAKPAAGKPAAQKPSASVDPFDMAELSLPETKPKTAKATVDAAAKPEIQAVSHSKAVDDLPEWARESTSRSAAEPPPVAASAQPGKPEPSPAALITLCPSAQGEVRELVGQLDASDTETVKRTIHRLGQMRTGGVAAAPALRKLLTHRDGVVRVHAALALIRMQQVTPEVTDCLIDALRSSEPAVRSFAAAVIAELGPQSSAVLPALGSALKDRDGYVRLHVAEVLIRHEEWSHAALRTLLDCLTDREENVRWLATYSLAELAPQSAEAVAALTAALHDPVPKVQIGAAYALGELGPIAHAARPALEQAANSNDPELRSAADAALQHIR